MFFHRVLDCYTLVRDYYHRERGIELLDFEREDDWWHKGQDLYMQGFERAGFAPLARGEEQQRAGVDFTVGGLIQRDRARRAPSA